MHCAPANSQDKVARLDMQVMTQRFRYFSKFRILNQFCLKIQSEHTCLITMVNHGTKYRAIITFVIS